MLRLFVAIYPSPEAAAALLAALDELSLPPHRPTNPDQLHLTAQFIGDTNERDLEEVRESVARSCSGLPAFNLTPRRIISLPERGPTRLLAAETDSPAPLLELHRRLAKRLAKSAQARDDGRFRPHLTLARFGAVPHLGVDHPLEMGAFPVIRVALVRSVLHTSGAEHRAIGEFPLGA